MSVIISEKKEARDQIKAGVKILANAVSSTLGAAGRAVIIDTLLPQPFITADGVTVAMHVEVDHPFQQIGVSIVKDVAMNTNTVAGDGTTTSIVLAQAMLEFDHLAYGKSPALVKLGMDAAVKDVSNYLDKISKKVTKSDLINIATISSRGDESLGKLIAQCYGHIGLEGQIVVEQGRGEDSSVQFISGYQLDCGYANNLFVNDKEREAVDFKDAVVLVSDLNLYSIKDMEHLLNEVASKRVPIIIIGADASDTVLNTLVSNSVKGVLPCVYMQAPDFGENQTALLEDLAFSVGAKFISEQTGAKFSDVKFEDLGTCDNFIAYKASSVFINKTTTSTATKKYIKSLYKSNENKEFYTKRVARLHGKLAKLVVGAKTSTEMRETYDRAEDAKNATRAALEQGYVVGGGCALLRAGLSVVRLLDTQDEKAGYDIVINSLSKPAWQILFNLYDNEEVTDREIEKISEMEDHIGFNVRTLRYVDMVEAGVIDPVKVTKSALESAVSVVSTILNTSCVIATVGDNRDLVL